MKKTDTKLHDALDAVGETVDGVCYKHPNIPFKNWICEQCGDRFSNQQAAVHHHVSKHVRDA